jgi:PPIC-type PPIASE domain
METCDRPLSDSDARQLNSKIPSRCAIREILHRSPKSEFRDSLVKLLFSNRPLLKTKSGNRCFRYEFFISRSIGSDRLTASLHKPARHAVRNCERHMTTPALPTDQTLQISSNENSDRGAVAPANRLAHSLRPIVAGAARYLRREPLLHFVLLGALIFGADAVLHPPPKDDKVITVTKALRQSFIDNFDEDKTRTPSDAELEKMIESWVASEILYREGKALGVDRGDDMIRDRVAFKLQLLIFDQIRVARPTEEQLRAWFADNHERFDEQERVGFYLTPPTDETTAQRQLADIEGQHESEDLQKQTRAILGRPVSSLAASFGESFRDALLALPVGQWKILQSKDGWHVVRLDSRRPGMLASLDSVRDEAARIWLTDETRKRAWEAVTRLKASYSVRYEQ